MINLVQLDEILLPPIAGEWGEEANGDSGVSVLRTTNFQNDGKLNYDNVVKRSISAGKVARKKLQPGDIIIEKSGGSPNQPVGRVVLFTRDSEDYLCNNFTAVLRPQGGVHPDYVFWAMFDMYRRRVVERYQNKTTGIINLQTARYLKEKIPLPPLEEQRRIAKVLSLADGLRQKARSMQEELDALAGSLFLELFGDPVSSDSVHRMEPLGNHLAEIESGWSPTCDKEWTSEDQWGVLELGAVTKGVYLSNRVKPLPTSLAAKPKLEVQTGDLLFSRKNTRELVGACAYVFESVPRRMIPDTIFRLRLNNSSQLSKEYIWGLFNQPGFKRRIQNLAGGSAGSMPNISKAKLWTLAVPVPDPQRQVQFADQLWELERKRTGCKEYSMNLQDLFNALLQKAFKGELTFNDAAFEALEG